MLFHMVLIIIYIFQNGRLAAILNIYKKKSFYYFNYNYQRYWTKNYMFIVIFHALSCDENEILFFYQNDQLAAILNFYKKVFFSFLANYEINLVEITHKWFELMYFFVMQRKLKCHSI